MTKNKMFKLNKSEKTAITYIVTDTAIMAGRPVKIICSEYLHQEDWEEKRIKKKNHNTVLLLNIISS